MTIDSRCVDAPGEIGVFRNYDLVVQGDRRVEGGLETVTAAIPPGIESFRQPHMQESALRQNDRRRLLGGRLRRFQSGGS